MQRQVQSSILMPELAAFITVVHTAVSKKIVHNQLVRDHLQEHGMRRVPFDFCFSNYAVIKWEL